MDNTKRLATFYSRSARKVELDKEIKSCSLCEGLNIPGETESAPGYGNVMSPVMFIGQSLCTKCMDTQIPFTRGSGDILDEVFWSMGKNKYDYFVTNVVHCHPPGNRASAAGEIVNCSEFLVREISLIKPELIIALGKDAKTSLSRLDIVFPPREFNVFPTRVFGRKASIVWIKHPAYFLYKNDPKGKKLYMKKLKEILSDETLY